MRRLVPRASGHDADRAIFHGIPDPDFSIFIYNRVRLCYNTEDTNMERTFS